MARDRLIDLYHRTTPEAAAAIMAEGRFVTRENTAEAFVSNRVDGQAIGYGDAVVEFPDGEQHFRIPLRGAQVVDAFTVDESGSRHPLATASPSRAVAACYPQPAAATPPGTHPTATARPAGQAMPERGPAVQR